MRSLTCLTVLTLALGLGACNGEGDDTTTTTNTTPSTQTEPTTTDAMTTPGTNPTMDGTTDPTTTDAMTTPGATDPTTDGTTTDVTTTAPTTGDETTTDPTTGGDEALYGPCLMENPPCAGTQQCLMVGGLEGNFCAPKCDGMACPPAPEGVTAMPQCALMGQGEMTATSCALICNPMGPAEQCGTGMSCKPVPMQAGVGLCTAP